MLFQGQVSRRRPAGPRDGGRDRDGPGQREARRAAAPAGAAAPGAPSRGPRAGQAGGTSRGAGPDPARPARNRDLQGPGRRGRGAGTGTPGTGTAGTGRQAGFRTGTGATRAAGRPYAADRAAIRPAPGHAKGTPRNAAAQNMAAQGAAAEAARPAEADAARLPWYEVAHAKRAAEGYQNCGPLERVLRREWPPSKIPSPPVVRAVNRLAELPLMIKEILAAGVDAIHVGEGGVPELDDMARLRGVPLPSGRATWDACAGAYGEKKIIVGSRPSSAPDVMCHEVGHALDDIDREQGRWQSDSAEFRQLYQRCEGSLVSDFHRQAGDLGRREFFADAFAAIASRQRPALVDMLGGNIRTALDVMLYFNLRYGL